MLLWPYCVSVLTLTIYYAAVGFAIHLPLLTVKFGMFDDHVFKSVPIQKRNKPVMTVMSQVRTDFDVSTNSSEVSLLQFSFINSASSEVREDILTLK